MSASVSSSDTTIPAGNVVLHIWPGAFGLASIEPTCLAAVLYLQPVINRREINRPRLFSQQYMTTGGAIHLRLMKLV